MRFYVDLIKNFAGGTGMTLKNEVLRKIDDDIEKISDQNLCDIGGGLSYAKTKNPGDTKKLVHIKNEPELKTKEEFVNC